MAVLACYVLVLGLLATVLQGKELNQSDKPELHILGMFPMTNGGWLGGKAVLISTQLAIGDINNRSDILPDYHLKLHWQDSQCLAGAGINALFSQLYTPPVKHIIFGPGCSITCQPTAEASHVWNVTQIAYGCTSPSLSVKKVYKRFFRTVVPDTHLVPLHLKMMKLFHWTKISTIHQSYDVFTSTADFMTSRLSEENITELTSESFLSDPTQQIENLKRKDARIIFGGFYANAARKVFCEAYKHGLYGPKYAWFAPMWFKPDWWREEDTDCDQDEMQQAVDGVFYSGMSYRNPMDVRGLAGMSNTELIQRFSELTGGQAMVGRALTASFYDGFWALALALNATVATLKEIGHPKTLEQFTYSDADIGDVITESMRSIDFQGVLGRLTFDKNGDPTRIIELAQQQGDTRVTVGYYQAAPNHRDEEVYWVNDGIQWLGDRPPRDSSITRKERQYVSRELYGTMCTVTSLGIVTAIFFLSFNLVFRNRRRIKASSPNINNVILLGCCLAYCTVFLQERPGAGSTDDILCSARIFAFIVGFSLAFGGLLSKTWRIHKILTMSTKLKKVVIKDSKLIGIVMALVSVDVLILVVWQVVDSLRRELKDLPVQISEKDPDVETIPQIHVCTSEHKLYFTGALYVIQGMLLAFGAFLAWETRKVKVEALNDSQQIGVCIYNVLTLSVLGAAVSLMVDDNVDVYYGFTSAIIIVGTTLIQCIIFVPKVLGVLRGETSVNVTGSVVTATRSSTVATGAATRQSSHMFMGKLGAA